MKKYLIENHGCDDTTSFEIELNDEELEVILKFIKLNNQNSQYSCQPEIRIYEDYFYNNNIPTSYMYVNGNLLSATCLMEVNE
jgi:hypothetical protein